MAKNPKIEVNDQVSFFSGEEEVTGTIKEIITRRWVDEKGNEQKARAYRLEESWWESEKADENLFVLSNEFDKYEIIEEEEEEESDDDNFDEDDDFEDDDDFDDEDEEDDEEDEEPEEKPKKKVKTKRG